MGEPIEFFDNLHTVLRRAGRCRASLEDVERVYTGEMLGPGGQLNLEHYEGRLRMVLGDDDYPIAIELLTEAAVNDGVLRGEAVDRYHEHFPFRAEAPMNPIEYVLYVLGTTDIWSGTVTATGRSGAVLSRADGGPDRPGGRPHGVLQEPHRIAAGAGAAGPSCARRPVEAGHHEGDRGPNPTRYEQAQRPAHAPRRSGHRPGRGRQCPAQAVLPDRAPVQQIGLLEVGLQEEADRAPIPTVADGAVERAFEANISLWDQWGFLGNG